MVKANKSKNNVKKLKTVSINNLSHFYGKNENKKQVLNDVNLNIDKGELVLLKGPSGCGKTTLLTLIGALRTCQSGDLTVLNNQLNGASRKTRQILRRSIGMIFQGHNLLRCLTAEQNVQMGADLIKGLTYLQRREIARNWLSAVGLEEHHKKLPNDLSGGQKQRVAIARALSANPKLLLADEPTSALDSVTGREIVTLLRKLAKEQNCSVLMVTHDPRISDMADRILNNSLPNDVKVLTKKQFIEFEKNYWKNSTAIGFIFSLGALMGFVVGCVVVYQILYSDVTDHLPEYATLLAMGYRLKSLFFVVAREGFLLALFGYLPAYFSGQILYSVIRSSTKLPIIMDADKTILIFVLVLVMCMGSAAVAMRKLVDADPAEIF